MKLGKRARYPMKRTTSMTDISVDDISVMLPPPSDQNNNNNNHKVVMGFVSPRPMMITRRNSADYSQTSSSSSSFLRTCSLCNRRLPPGRDIFMYRGDSAFCSLECRQHQMTQDEWREKFAHNGSNSSSSQSTAISDSVAAS